MSKKLFLSLFLTLTLSAAFTQNTVLKHYRDYDQDFEGYAQAEYIDKFDVEALSAFFDKLEGETLSAFLNNEPDVVSAPIQKRIKETFLPKIEELSKTDSSEAFLGLLPILLLGAMLTANQGAMENLAEPSPTPPIETPDADQKPMGNIELIPVPKLTKNNKWLMEQALNEWELSPGEVYLVTCAKTRYATSGLVILVGITSPEEYEWRAYLVEEK